MIPFGASLPAPARTPAAGLAFVDQLPTGHRVVQLGDLFAAGGTIHTPGWTAPAATSAVTLTSSSVTDVEITPRWVTLMAASCIGPMPLLLIHGAVFGVVLVIAVVAVWLHLGHSADRVVHGLATIRAVNGRRSHATVIPAGSAAELLHLETVLQELRRGG